MGTQGADECEHVAGTRGDGQHGGSSGPPALGAASEPTPAQRECVNLVRALAYGLVRDPRVHPRRGDILDDDPPLVPLTVVAVWPNEDKPRVIEAERRSL